VIILDEENNFHHIFYYWNIVDKAWFQILEDLLKQSKTVNQVINNFGNVLGENLEAV